ncbi:MAG: AAA family ATPase [Chloracidobacterium sp.]|nr:AAA family ATPase [Chloracidobacterium sp.]MDW8218154.1 AAA family ATPase [Acidobacteriota bacterium]
MNLAEARAANVRGNEYLQQGDYAAAIAAYREAIAHDPYARAYPRERGIIHANLAYALSLAGDLTAACEAYQAAIRLEPRRATYHNELGDVLFRLEDWSAALAAYQRAAQAETFLRVYPEAPGLIQYNLGLTYSRLGDVEAARRHLAEAVRREPNNPNYRAALEEVRPPVEAPPPDVVRRRPTFADIGGYDDAKRSIAQAVRIVLEAERAARYRIRLNGILLVGEPGSGKTFFAEATAGEFQLPLLRVTLSEVTSKWAGESVERLHQVFEQAAQRAPCLLFFDDFDGLAATLRDTESNIEHRRFLEAFIQHVEQVRSKPGVVLMAATSQPNALEAAMVRPGRFDWRIILPPPGVTERRAILESLLNLRPIGEVNYDRWAARTAGYTAADLARLVNTAALAAFAADQPIADQHLAAALAQFEAKERFFGVKRSWADIVMADDVRATFRLIQQLLEDPEAGRVFGLTPPRGAVLYGPPGTGKTTLARVLAYEARCSFYAVTPSDIYAKWAGESERRVTELFQRARANRPSILFFDEADALFGVRSAAAGEAAPHVNRVVNQFLAEMDGMRANDRLFVLAATNRLDLIDPAILRAGRLSEKIHVPLPNREQRRALFALFTQAMRLEETVCLEALAEATVGKSGADIEEICQVAARAAFLRCLEADGEQRCVTYEDFRYALSLVGVALAKNQTDGRTAAPSSVEVATVG